MHTTIPSGSLGRGQSGGGEDAHFECSSVAVDRRICGRRDGVAGPEPDRWGRIYVPNESLEDRPSRVRAAEFESDYDDVESGQRDGIGVENYSHSRGFLG